MQLLWHVLISTLYSTSKLRTPGAVIIIASNNILCCYCKCLVIGRKCLVIGRKCLGRVQCMTVWLYVPGEVCLVRSTR